MKVPSYRHHKASGQALVEFKGHRIYLGKYGSPQSQEKYRRLIAEWAVSPQVDSPQPKLAAEGLSVNELILAYWDFARGYYCQDGVQTSEVGCIRNALAALKSLYGLTPANSFGPKTLKAVQQHMISMGLSRRVINSHIGRIKRCFKWGASEELIAPAVFQGLQSVSGLSRGRTTAKESERVLPVLDLHVSLTLPFLPPQVAAIVKLQRLTGARPCEILAMRLAEIDTTGPVWHYNLRKHKTQWRGRSRQIPLGPEAQELLLPFLNRPQDAYLFSPVEAVAWRKEHLTESSGRGRKTKIYPSELRRREREKRERKDRPKKRAPGDRYTTDSYRRAIVRAIRQANMGGFIIPHWHPHQLRHSRATEVRSLAGLEAAQVSLGHAKANVTEVYAERNLELAAKVAKKWG